MKKLVFGVGAKVSLKLPPSSPRPRILSHGLSALPSATETALLHYVDRIGLSFSCATLGSSALAISMMIQFKFCRWHDPT
ncbi:Glutathione S-transferase U2 [Fusarium oxysporum f. sp. albedinis]|nr:Glutathione S-transferase U2 [Fusarium oxysporum f. sp. albedinis]